MENVQITKASLKVFLKYAKDAGNWSGYPWVSAGNIRPTKEERGNLSDLVKKDLISIQDYEGRGRSEDMYVQFEDSGVALAQSHGIEIDE